MIRCAFLTCQDMSGFISDDELLIHEFQAQGMSIESVVWTNDIDWQKFDVAIIRTTWDYTRKLDLFLNTLTAIEQSGCRLFNSAQIVRWNAYKTYLMDLEQQGIAIVPSVFLLRDGVAVIEDSVQSWRCPKIVLKPIVGACADDIVILGVDDGLERIKTLKQDDDNSWFVQPFLDEIVRGEVSLHFFNNEFSHAVKKIPKPGDFRVQEEFGADIIPYKPNQAELKIAEDIFTKLETALLYGRVDLVNHKGQPLLIELELIEPSLYFRTDSESPNRFFEAFRALVVN